MIDACAPAAASRYRTLGVLGGMGPAATIDFMAKLVARTPALRDEEHIPCIIISDPRLPDRTEAFLGGDGAEVLKALSERLRRLEAAGADAFVMPCNSAHHWAETLAAQTRLPLIHIADASLAEAVRRAPGARRIAIMGTPVTLRSGFYQRRMLSLGLAPLTLQDAMVERVLSGVRHIKAGDLVGGRDLLSAAASEIFAIGADVILMACTEIPLVLKEGENPRLIDTSAALALASVVWSGSAGARERKVAASSE